MSSRIQMKLYYLQAPEDSYQYYFIDIKKAADDLDISYYEVSLEVDKTWGNPTYEDRVLFTSKKDANTVSYALPFNKVGTYWEVVEMKASFKARFS